MKQNPKIWIVNYYTTPPEFVTNERHLKFAYYLMNEGYDVTIISSSFIHGLNVNLVKDHKKYEERTYGQFKFVHIKSESYSGNDFKRMFSIFQFASRLFFLRKKFDRPDIILHNIHAPFDFMVYYCAKTLKAKYIAEAWDLWPESFVRLGLINGNNPLVRISYLIEKKLYKNADKVIFSFEGGYDYLVKQGWDMPGGGPVDLDKVHYINNGVDIDEFENNKTIYKLVDDDLENDSFFKVIYLGSVRYANNIRQLIDAALILRDDPTIMFLIYGDGPDRIHLENYCKENNLKNVLFKQKSIELKYVPYVLSRSSLNILNYRKDFGIYGVSSGKLFQYLASGKPVVSNIEMNYCLISRHNLGIARNLETARQYADAILSIKNLDPESYNSMCDRTREVAKQFDFKLLSQKLIRVIDDLVPD